MDTEESFEVIARRESRKERRTAVSAGSAGNKGVGGHQNMERGGIIHELVKILTDGPPDYRLTAKEVLVCSGEVVLSQTIHTYKP